MAPRSRLTKSSSIDAPSTAGGSTVVAVNGDLIPSETPDSASGSPTTRRSRRMSTTSPPDGSPIVALPEKIKISQPVVRKTVTVGKFILVVILSALLEAGLQTAGSFVTAGDLAAISKRTNSWVEISALVGWKVVLLGVYWFGGFDAYDVASLTLLLSTPTTILLGLFYSIAPSTLTLNTLSSILSNALPYYLLRPLTPAHTPGSVPKSQLRNRPILTDPYTSIATSLLAATILAVTLEASLATFLPSWLIVHFTGLRTLEPAHLGAAGLPALLLSLLPSGVACMEFLFAPSAATPTVLMPIFDPLTSSFGAHIYHNAWGWYSARQKLLIRRTALLALLIVVNTVVHQWGTMAGVEILGALGYGGVWAGGAILVGGVLDWVGGPSDESGYQKLEGY